MRVNSELAAKSKGFGQTFYHSCDEEISRQLDRVGSVSFLATDESLLPNRVEEWPAEFDLFGCSSGNNEELRSGCSIRPAEHWCRKIVLLFFAVSFGQTARQVHADGAHGDVNRAGGQLLDRIAGREDDSLHGSVIRQHSHEHLCIGGSFAGRFRNPSAQRSKRLSAASCPVINR